VYAPVVDWFYELSEELDLFIISSSSLLSSLNLSGATFSLFPSSSSVLSGKFSAVLKKRAFKYLQDLFPLFIFF